jgi:hypothetical protein
MPMRRLALLLALIFALAFAASAWAGAYNYMPRQYLYDGYTGSSYFSSTWWQNVFVKPRGKIGTVLFIDNVTYGWHVLVRNDSEYTATHWFSSQVKKAHCRANSNGFYGSCTVYN